jgi:uridine phosphorylase
MPIAESELILTSDHKVYHLNLCGQDVADDVIVVGDQNRVEQISRHFSEIEFKTSHREFITHTGIFRNKRITVLSTGIGPDNIDIVINELDAAVNFDLNTRKPSEKKRSLRIYRLGTCGAIQPDIKVDTLILSAFGIGLDGLLHFYDGLPFVNEEDLIEHLTDHVKWPQKLAHPYCISANNELLKKFSLAGELGITLTAPGFYAPQGRHIRLAPAHSTLNSLFETFEYKGMRILNFEMETSAMYGLGKLLGHECLTVCVAIANRSTGQFSADLKKSTDHLIEKSLNLIAA